MMEKIGRERRSESTWREIVARQAESGLSVQAFCEREGIKVASLYGWRSRLRQEGQDESTPPREARRAPQEKATGEFIDLGALSSSRSRFEVRLDLGGGVLLHLVRG
jgi:transposase-like protein